MTVCGWELDFAECANTDALDNLCGGEPAEDPNDEPVCSIRDRVEQMAIEFLWNWTGRLYGPCPIRYRPCRQNCTSDSGSMFRSGAPWTPILCNGRWYNVTCGRCRQDQCGCENTSALNLGWPVASIVSITIDGEVLPETSYRLDNNQLLVRMDGEAWPPCNRLDLPTTEEGTWEIVFERGIEVPIGGRIAAGILANEMAKAICGDASCALPKRIQSITRQGVTIALVDNFDALNEKGQTGIWLVDSWVASVTSPKRGGSVRSVDVPVKRYSPLGLL